MDYCERAQCATRFDFLFLFRGWPHTEAVRGRAGWVRGCPRHGCRGQAKDGFTASTACFAQRPSSQPRGAPLAENSVPLDARHSATFNLHAPTPQPRAQARLLDRRPVPPAQRPLSNPDPPPCARTSPPVPTAPAAVPVRHAPAAPPGRWPRFPAHGPSCWRHRPGRSPAAAPARHPQVFHLPHARLPTALVVRTCGHRLPPGAVPA